MKSKEANGSGITGKERGSRKRGGASLLSVEKKSAITALLVLSCNGRMMDKFVGRLV